MLRSLVSALLVLGILALAGCGGGSDNGSNLTTVNVNLTQAQDVQRVTVLHQDPSSGQWDSVFVQDYNNQSTIDLNLNLIAGDNYRIEALTIDPNTGQQQYSSQDFVAGGGSSSSYSYNEPTYARSQPTGRSFTFSVPTMSRETASTAPRK